MIRSGKAITPRVWIFTPGIDRLRHATPQAGYLLAGRLVPRLGVAAALLFTVGLSSGLVVAMSDVPGAKTYLIGFLHAPATWMSLLVYLVMACCAGAGFQLDLRLSSMLAAALAPTGAMLSFLALWTGALWDRPTWGTWWSWDARMSWQLLLLVLNLVFMALHAAIDDPLRADRASAIVALAGAVCLPVLYLAMVWLDARNHAPVGNPSAALSLGYAHGVGLLLMSAGFAAYAVAVALSRLRSVILERERDSDWVTRIPEIE